MSDNIDFIKDYISHMFTSKSIQLEFEDKQYLNMFETNTILTRSRHVFITKEERD